MCGIYGALGPWDASVMERIGGALIHRGPDDCGEHAESGVYLGHRRLSIIDLATGHQPMANEDGSVHVVYNGEIYNYRELAAELRARGHSFRTASDTEVIVHAWEEWGHEAWPRLNGIFAFALWDRGRRQLVLVRDRLGVKPLYWASLPDGLVFASELGALLRHPQVHGDRIRPDKVSEFLVHRHTSGPETIVDGVNKISPGHWLQTTLGGSPKVGCYWRIDPRPEIMDGPAAIGMFRDTLRQSVQSQLMSDVPLGILLSGGIDSAALVAFAAESQPDLHTFTIGFEGDAANEFADAAKIARHFGTVHSELTVRPGNISLLPEIIRRNDEPVAGPSSLAYWLMLEQVRAKGIKVVLLGHGADELCGGYEQLRLLPRLERLRASPASPLIDLGLAAAGALFPDDTCLRRTRKLFSTLGRAPEEAYMALMSVVHPAELGALMRAPSLPARLTQPLTPWLQAGLAFEDAVMAAEMGPWLADDLLHRVDRMCMAHSIEGRVPYLDNRMVDLAFRLPYPLKTTGGREKGILREAVRGIVPAEVLNRRKQRFNTAINHFFGPRLDSICRRLFAEENPITALFCREALMALLDFRKAASYRLVLRRHRLFAQFFARQIWAVLTLIVWYKTVVEGDTCEEMFQDRAS